MEATAVQPVTNNDVGRKLISLEEGSKRAPEGAFSALVEKIIAEEEKPALVSSEDVTQASGEDEDSGLADEEILQDPGAVPVAILGFVSLDDLEISGAEVFSSVSPPVDEVAKESAPPAATDSSDSSTAKPEQAVSQDELPKPAVEGLASGLAQVVAEELPEGFPEGLPEGRPPEVSLPGAPSGQRPVNFEEVPNQPNTQVSDASEAQESLMNLVDEEVSKGFPAAKPEENPASLAEPLAVEEKSAPKSAERLMDIPGLSQLDKDPDAIKAQAKSMDIGDGEARRSSSPDVPQKHEVRAEKGMESSFSVGVDSSKEMQPATPLPSTPKESVGVETVMLVPPEEAHEAEVEPIKPVNGGDILQTNSRSAEGLEAAKSLSQPQSSASTQETSALNRPSAPPVVGRIVEKVVEVVQAGNHNERHEVSIQLSPPSLGKIHLRVLVEDSKLHVALFTTTQEARELVESNTSQLKAALHQQGLMLEQFSVGVRSGLAHNMPQQDWLGWQENFASGQFFQGPGATSKEAAAEPWAYQRRDAVSRVDLFI